MLLAVVNIRGTRSGARLSVAMALIKLTPLALLVVAGLFAIHGPNLHWTRTPPAGLIGQGAVLLFFAFMGIEGGLSTSGEVLNPARTVPRAIAMTLTLVAALYIGLQFVAQGVLGADLAVAKTPLVATATAVFGPSGTGFLVAATILSAGWFFDGGEVGQPATFYCPCRVRAVAREVG